MRRLTFLVLLVAGLGLQAGTSTGCSGGGAGDVAGVGAVTVDASLVDQAWPVTVATTADVDRYGNDAGWLALVMRRDYGAAVKALGPKGGLAAARAHADAAALYRQAALTSAYALIETYAKTPQDSDPLGCAHLLAVSYAITGKLDDAKAQSKRLDGQTDPTGAWHAPWKAWLDAGGAWPPDLSSLPLALGAPAPGGWPDAGNLPHYTMAERGEGTRSVDMGDPGALVALALWHDAAARAAAGTQAGSVDVYGARFRMPAEPHVAATDPLPPELLFGADYLVPADGPFMAALTGDRGVAAIDDYKSTSLLASIAAASRVDGKLSAEKVVDYAAALRAALVNAAKAKNQGQELPSHRTFADVGTAGALRALALVAEVEGNREQSGILRINAMERSNDAAAAPEGLLSLAAWDASNRYPARGTEMLHTLIRRYPSLETARYGLDVLAVRVSRERIEPPPGM